MRVMAAGDPEENHNGARILALFDDGGEYVPSVYSHISEVQAVETFPSAARSAMSVMRYRGGNSKWFYADFPMAYDPCVCEYESRMSMRISLIDTAMVNLSGDITGTLADITDQTNGQVEEDGYSFQELVGAGKQAQKSYKTVNAWTKAQLKALKIEGLTPAYLNQQEQQKVNQLNALQAVLKTSTFLQKGLAAAPYIAGALELVKFFVAGGSESPGPEEVKLTPMAMNANISLQGNIVSTYPFDDVIFYTPGSKNANNESQAEWYPFYNEVMGTFNLMEKPKLFYNLSTTSIPSTPMATIHDYKLKLDESSLKLLMNPSADLEVQEIQAAITLREQIYSLDMLSVTEGLSVEPFYRSRVVKLGCLPDFTFDVRSMKPLSEIGLKLYINLKREDADMNTQNVLLVLEYSAELGSQFGLAGSFWDDPYEGYKTDIMLDGSQGVLTTDLIAWETITIEDGATFQPGPNGIKIIAGEEIIVAPDADIPPGVELIIGDPTQCTQTIPLQTASQIQTFCQSNTYQHPNRQMRMAREGAQLSKADELSLTAHPNPFTASLTLRYPLPETGPVTLILYDAMGRPIRTLQEGEWTKAGPQELLVPAHDLPAGLYHAVLQAGEARASVKVVKQ